ncbi:hypothetical protein JW826_06505 [Candidatus Woesearchaeota archaeon]|nr:hypothetical protein [Candidatus Woesearchaeota archaeon]
MGNPFEETKKRLRLAEEEANRYRDLSLCVILAGSVAYSPNHAVTESSDLDLIVVSADVKGMLSLLIEDSQELSALKNRFFEGYCLKRESQGIPVSIHLLSEDAFDIISKCFVSNMRVYRPKPKPEAYSLHGFDGAVYPYFIKNVSLPDLRGVRTIVPISFIYDDRYHLGIHRDKLLSNPKILCESEQHASARIDKLWAVVVENLYDEAHRLYGHLDLGRMNVLNALSRSHKMTPAVIAEITGKTSFYLSRLR